MKNFLKKILIILSFFVLSVLVTACGVTKKAPVVIGENKTVVNIVDSVKIRDSVVVIPVERIVDIVAQYDTLKMETTLAKASAYVDTNLHALRGSIENKEQVIFRDRWKERIVEVHDTVSVKEPIPYETVKEVKHIPKWVWFLLIFSILETVILGYLIYFLFFKNFWK